MNSVEGRRHSLMRRAKGSLRPTTEVEISLCIGSECVNPSVAAAAGGDVTVLLDAEDVWSITLRAFPWPISAGSHHEHAPAVRQTASRVLSACWTACVSRRRHLPQTRAPRGRSPGAASATASISRSCFGAGHIEARLAWQTNGVPGWPVSKNAILIESDDRRDPARHITVRNSGADAPGCG